MVAAPAFSWGVPNIACDGEGSGNPKMSCDISHKVMVELTLAAVYNSEAYSELCLSFFHSSVVSERGFASRSWHESNVNSFALYYVMSDGSLRAFMRNNLACGSLLVFSVCVLGVLSSFQRNFLSTAANREIHNGRVLE